jgi:hypothetical protein
MRDGVGGDAGIVGYSIFGEYVAESESDCQSYLPFH